MKKFFLILYTFVTKDILDFYKNVSKKLFKKWSKFFGQIQQRIENLNIKQLVFLNHLIWVIVLYLSLTIIAIIIGIIILLFAQLGLNWFIGIWDNWILSAYAFTSFHHNWWWILMGIMLLSLFLLRTWHLPDTGKWTLKTIILMVSYTLFYTLFLVFSWQLQYYLWNHNWFFFIVAFFVISHYLSLVSIAIISNVIYKIKNLNMEYIKETRTILIDKLYDKPDPVHYIFKSSIYGFMMIKLSTNLYTLFLSPVVKQVIKKKESQKKIRNFFNQIVYIVSFSWLFDVFFGKKYYVEHFDMLMRDLLKRNDEKEWEMLSSISINPALTSQSVRGIFIDGE